MNRRRLFRVIVWSLCAAVIVPLLYVWRHPLKAQALLGDRLPLLAALVQEKLPELDDHELEATIEQPTPVISALYFPRGAFGPELDQFTHTRYSGVLARLHEPSLFEDVGAGKERYRFTWMRSFHSQISVRLEVQSDGTGQLISKQTSAHPAADTALPRESFRTLSRRQTAQLIQCIEDAGFWKEPMTFDGGGLDGATWLLEGSKSRRYHLMERWSPENGQPFKPACLSLLEAADFWQGPVY